MKQQKDSAKVRKVAAILCILCAVIWTAKLVLLLALHVERDHIDWVIELACAVVWWVAAVVNTLRLKHGAA